MYPDDFSYIGGMNEIEKNCMCIPDDISVAGFDGIYLSQVLRPRLTTLRQDTNKIGSEAARQLAKAIESPRTFIPERIIVPGEVLEGDTVKQIG
jgi:LacI family transcriptional regulator